MILAILIPILICQLFVRIIKKNGVTFILYISYAILSKKLAHFTFILAKHITDFLVLSNGEDKTDQSDKHQNGNLYVISPIPVTS